MATDRHYSVYATLLDTFQRFLDAEDTYHEIYTSDNPSVTIDEWCDKMYSDLMDRINRVPYESDAATRGTAFNELVDALVTVPLEQRIKDDNLRSEHITLGVVTLPVTRRRKQDTDETREMYRVMYEKGSVKAALDYPKDITDEFVDYYQGAQPQVFCKGTLETAYGLIDLYGFIDELLPFSVHDIKTASRYKAGSFKSHWQHIVYPYCLHCMGSDVDRFEYNVTNFRETFSEVYVYNAERDVPKLREHCELFIEFIEAHRSLITETRLFNPLGHR